MITEIEVTQDLIVQVDVHGHILEAFTYAPAICEWIEIGDKIRNSSYWTGKIEDKLKEYRQERLEKNEHDD